MIKKLDILIIKAFLGPFIITFFIALFVLIMQNLWKYIDDLVGKGLDFFTIITFLWYISATLFTLAMPIAILVSSIMTFGNLGESFELVAIKSSGVSLLRFMRPLVGIAILMCGVTFLFANYVIPYANLKSANLLNDINTKKPAFNLVEGQFFTQIPGYAIRASKKDADGKTLHGVLIYEKNQPLPDNAIIADKGVLTNSTDGKFLQFDLENGFRYQERGNPYDSSTEYIRLGFASLKKLFDLTTLGIQNTDFAKFSKNSKWQSVRQLGHSLDSLHYLNDSLYKRMDKEISFSLHYMDTPDSSWKKVANPVNTVKSFDELIPDSLHYTVYENALDVAARVRASYENTGGEIDNHTKDIRYHYIEWHRKFSLSMACLVLLFIGAPLGSIIRKGGLGMPLVVAIVFFLLFHLLNMFGEKFAKEGITSPVIGMWLAVIVLTPVGIFLTYKAMHDSQLFNKEYYYRAIKRLRPLLSIFRRKA